jgi:hypothetical protein
MAADKLLQLTILRLCENYICCFSIFDVEEAF